MSPQLLRHRNSQAAASAEDATQIAKGHNGEFYVSEAAPDGQTWYLAMTIDRENYCPAVLVSKHGGDDIQTIASEHPETISKFDFGLTEGVSEDLVAAVAGAMQIQDRQNIKDVLRSMHGIFASKDATMLEITSLARGKNGKFVAVDSNFTFDDDAGKRQQDLFELRDKEQEIRDEVEAEKHGLVYIRMDGNIGNVVNGAGLAMATNDAVSLAGGQSANFLDAGGQATKETMIQAFSIILRDERVKAILVNIYGGITRCDMIAESIIGAAAEMDINVPMVVRLQGTNSPQGLRLVSAPNDTTCGLQCANGFVAGGS